MALGGVNGGLGEEIEAVPGDEASGGSAATDVG